MSGASKSWQNPAITCPTSVFEPSNSPTNPRPTEGSFAEVGQLIAGIKFAMA